MHPKSELWYYVDRDEMEQNKMTKKGYQPIPPMWSKYSTGHVNQWFCEAPGLVPSQTFGVSQGGGPWDVWGASWGHKLKQSGG